MLITSLLNPKDLFQNDVHHEVTVPEITACLRFVANDWVIGKNTSDKDITAFVDWNWTRSTWFIPHVKDTFLGKLDYYHPFKVTTLVEKDKWKENGYFHHETAKHIFCKTVLPAFNDMCKVG